MTLLLLGNDQPFFRGQTRRLQVVWTVPGPQRSLWFCLRTTFPGSQAQKSGFLISFAGNRLSPRASLGPGLLLAQDTHTCGPLKFAPRGALRSHIYIYIFIYIYIYIASSFSFARRRGRAARIFLLQFSCLFGEVHWGFHLLKNICYFLC